MSKLLVTGSLAFDRIAVFKDRFKNHILPEKVHVLNVSFVVDDLAVHFGGTGGNIAYNLALLGEAPLLLATAGRDFDDYYKWLKQNGVLMEQVKVLPEVLTAQATVTTDLDDNQITAFYGGAMFRAHEAKANDLPEVTAAIIAANGKQAMLDYAAHFRQQQVRFIADPGQALPVFNGDELWQLIEGAEILVMNDYEWQLIQQKLGLQGRTSDIKNLLNDVGHLIVTYGEKGSKIWSRGSNVTTVPAVKAKAVVDPTGCGDAYRAGLLYGMKHEWPIERSAKLGAWLGAQVVACKGTQNHNLTSNELEKTLGEW